MTALVQAHRMSTATENEIVRNIALVFLNNIAQATVFVFLYGPCSMTHLVASYPYLTRCSKR